jgi:hypothetical protein
MSRYASQGQAGVAIPDLEETKKSFWHHGNQRKMIRGSVPRALVTLVRSRCSPLRRSSCITQSLKGRQKGNDLRFEKYSKAP